MQAATSQIDILFISHKHDLIGGAEKALLEQVEYLVSIGLRPHIIVGARGTFSDKLEKIGVSYSIIFTPQWAHGEHDLSNFIFVSQNPSVNTTLQIVNLIRSLKPKLCVTNTLVIPWLAYAAALTNIPHAWFVHEIASSGLKLRYSTAEEQVFKTLDVFSDAIFYNSDITRKHYARYIKNCAIQKVIYPVGVALRPAKIASPFPKQSLKLICVSQIKPQKGQIDAIKAVKSLDKMSLNPHLVLIGQDEDLEYMKMLKQYISSSNISDKVTFLGHQQNPASYVAHADIAIVSSTNDAFGRVTVEAQALKKPVICADSGGSREIVTHQKNGLLYKPGDENDLSDQIVHLAQDKTYSRQIAQQGYETCLQRFSNTNRFADFMKFYKCQQQRRALSLEPLSSAFTDFDRTVELYKSREHQLNQIHNTRTFKIAHFIRNSLLKLISFMKFPDKHGE